jgi:hypothetical protein
VDLSSSLILLARFEDFNGEMSLYYNDDDSSSNNNHLATMTAADSSCLDRLRCVELELVGFMLNRRLTYSVRVLEEEGDLDPSAELVLVLLTDQKVLGRMGVEIPNLSADRRRDKPRWILERGATG